MREKRPARTVQKGQEFRRLPRDVSGLDERRKDCRNCAVIDRAESYANRVLLFPAAGMPGARHRVGSAGFTRVALILFRTAGSRRNASSLAQSVMASMTRSGYGGPVLGCLTDLTSRQADGYGSPRS